MTDAIERRIVEIIAKQTVLEPADVTRSSTLTELGIDSLGLVEAIFSIEESFDIQVPFNANDPADGAFDITSVETITRAVRQLIADQSK